MELNHKEVKMEEEKAKVEKKETKKIAQIVKVATEVARVVELEDGQQVDELELLVLIYNQQRELLRRI